MVRAVGGVLDVARPGRSRRRRRSRRPRGTRVRRVRLLLRLAGEREQGEVGLGEVTHRRLLLVVGCAGSTSSWRIRVPCSSVDGEAQPLDLDRLADLGDVSRELGEQPADRVGLGVDVGAEQLVEVVDRQARVDAVAPVAQIDDERLLAVVLVGDLADDLLEQVLERHETRRAAVLVGDDRDVRPRAHLDEQLLDRLGLRHEVRLARDASRSTVGARAVAERNEQVLRVQHAAMSSSVSW